MPTSQSVGAAHNARKRRLVALLAELADVLLGEEEQPRSEAPRYYSGDDPGPYLTRRAFLDAGRRGDFPSRKLGRRIVALAADVHAAIEARPLRAKSVDPLAKYQPKGRAA